MLIGKDHVWCQCVAYRYGEWVDAHYGMRERSEMRRSTLVGEADLPSAAPSLYSCMRGPYVCPLSTIPATIKPLLSDISVFLEAFARVSQSNIGLSLTMGLYTELPDDIHEVDVIVAGGNFPQRRAQITSLAYSQIIIGGTAGCVVASRLAEADPKLSVLLIEQGMNNHNVPEVVHPALFPRNLFLDSKNTLFWKGNKAPQLADRDPIVPSGGILGGGSSINWMVYTRAQRSDLDSWNTAGWSAKELLPFMNKVRIEILYIWHTL